MSCGLDKEKLTGYFDGELEAAGKAEVERHIGACSECLRELGEIKSAAQLVKGLPRLRAPRSIAEGVSREIAASGGRVPSLDRSRRRLGWLTLAAAAAFVALNITYFAGLQDRAPAASREAAPLIGSTELAKQAPAAKLEQRRAAPEVRDKRENESAEADRKALKDAAPVPAEAKKDGLGLPAKAEKAKEAEAPRPEPAKPETPAPLAKPDEAAKPQPRPAAAAAPAAPPPAPVAAPGAPAPRGEAAPAAERALKPAPETLTLVSTKLAASRAKFEEIFKKYGAELPEADSKLRTASPGGLKTVSLTLSAAGLEALKLELEKVGNARLLPVAPEDPSLAKLQEGAAKKKPAAVASGGSSRSKDAVGGFGAKAGARESGKDEAGRSVVIHLLEVGELPPADADK